jgi:two-component system CheB/CheR fusion protein
MWEPADSPPRVLVVDDNADTAESLSWLLQALGHEVRVAHAGAEAIDQARQFRPHAVLLDVGLPDLDGYEVARRLRAAPDHAGTLLIAATGHNRDRDRRRAAEAGFDHYLVKPFDPARVDQLLAAHRAAEGVSA